ncbi:RNA polymerase sigma factor SigM [Angustibacter sp. Root456]|uniref:RNA polymerase sigma factor SigM n=1 Tax=Angustibacter sp. Root456 TaxID=1736539 RepID=UPI0009E9BE0E|nr:RNA polymerase sigma factor SigM [Angustibacter sp. Root456]
MTARPVTVVSGLADAELLAAHVQGDPEAFGELVRRHRDRLWAVALRTLGDREEAADALQDALVSAYRRAESFRGESAVTTWLHRIVVNACLDRVRRRQARPTVALPEQEPADAVDAHDRTETAIDVRAALDRLPEHQRQALVLVDMHAMSVAEAAQVLEVAEGTIKSRCARGRAALAQLLRPGNLEGVPDVPPVTPAAPAPAAERPHPGDHEGGRA